MASLFTWILAKKNGWKFTGYIFFSRLLFYMYVCFCFLLASCSLYCNYIWWEQMCRLIGVSSSPSSALAPLPASHPYYLSWQYNQCFLPMLLNVFLLALIASFSLHCNSKWVWQITTIYLPRYTGFLCRPPPPHIASPALAATTQGWGI